MLFYFEHVSGSSCFLTGTDVVLGLQWHCSSVTEIEYIQRFLLKVNLLPLWFLFLVINTLNGGGANQATLPDCEQTKL